MTPPASRTPLDRDRGPPTEGVSWTALLDDSDPTVVWIRTTHRSAYDAIRTHDYLMSMESGDGLTLRRD